MCIRLHAPFIAYFTFAERRKAEGDLLPFDPSAVYVHPLSRVKMIIHANKRYGTTAGISSARTSSVGAEVVPDSQEEENYSESDDGDDDDEYDEILPLRRSGRSTTKVKQVLPFSPKRTTTRRILIIDSDNEPTESDDESEFGRPTRRSNRSRKGVKVNLDIETSEGETSDDYDSLKHSKPKGKKLIRPKATRPAYGHFRDVVDLNYDYSDDESTSIREHRDICEKCHRGPAHKLIEALAKKSKNKGKKKRQTSDDEFEEFEGEEERLTALGGWIRW